MRPLTCMGLLSGRLQPYQLFALILSIAAHSILGIVFGFGSGSQSGDVARQLLPTALLTVELKKPERTLFRPDPAIFRNNHLDKRLPDRSLDSSMAVARPTEKNPVIVISKESEPYYFRMDQLTDKPFVLRDIPPDLGSELFGVPPQSTVLRLLINEYGDIDQVMAETYDLPEQVRNLLIQAFSKAKFSPGKISGAPVKSQLQIRIAIESAAPDSGNR